jgi:signal transduction histidine kinase
MFRFFNLRNISIRGKLVLVMVFTSVLVLGVFFTVYIITDVKSYKDRKVESMISLAQVIGTNCVSTLEFQDNEAATQILEELQRVSPDIVYAAILDNHRKIFASYSRSEFRNFIIPAALDKKNSLFTGDYLIVANSITNNSGSIGKVILDVQLSELIQLKKDKIRIATILLVAAVLFSFLVAGIIQTYISRRLLNLVDTMKQVSDTGNYDTIITDKGRDEISVLFNVFSSLMERIKENQQRKDEFLSIVSHELKTPLTTIKGYLELLNSMEDKQPKRQFVQKGLENVKKLEKLISDLLDVSKIQRGQLKLEISEFNIDELVNETIAAFQMISTSHEIIRVDDFKSEIIVADKRRIEQVLTNLLSNAIKYSPNEKKVFVYCQKNPAEMIVKIRDFGIGVPKDEQSNIFERFYRSKGMSDSIVGFGLGLYICRDIIHRHDGKIWVESEKKGSTFYFSLPLKKISSTVKTEVSSVNLVD